MFHNEVAGQTLFYQVLLADTRDPELCPDVQPCLPVPATSASWFNTEVTSLGYNQCIGSFDAATEGACLRPGSSAAQHFSLPLLDRVVSAIADAAEHYGADGELSRWGVTGLYVGPGIQGGGVTYLRTSGLDLRYMLAGENGKERGRVAALGGAATRHYLR